MTFENASTEKNKKSDTIHDKLLNLVLINPNGDECCLNRRIASRCKFEKYQFNLAVTLLRCFTNGTVLPMKWHTKTILILASVICCTSLSLLIGDQFFDSVFKTFLGHITGLTTNGVLCAVAGVSLGTIIGIKLIK